MEQWLTKTELISKTGVSTNIIARIEKNEPVPMENFTKLRNAVLMILLKYSVNKMRGIKR